MCLVLHPSGHEARDHQQWSSDNLSERGNPVAAVLYVHAVSFRSLMLTPRLSPVLQASSRYARPSSTRRRSSSSVESCCFVYPRTPFSHTPLGPDECDARHGAYDFYAEQLAAPPDLKHLTDEHESMAFRRRGYEVRGRPGGLPQLLTRACADYTSATPFSKPWLAGLASSI